MHSLLRDLRFAVRRLVNDRWFTLAALLALSLGIGVNSAVFTLVNAVLLRGLPFDEPERITWVDTRDARGRTFGVSVDDYIDWRAATRTFSGIALVQSGQPNLSRRRPAPGGVPGRLYYGERVRHHRYQTDSRTRVRGSRRRARCAAGRPDQQRHLEVAVQVPIPA